MASHSYLLKTIWKDSCDRTRRNWAISFADLERLRRELVEDPNIELEIGQDALSCRGFLFYGSDIIPGFSLDCGDYYLKVEEV
jgi:hypothetical protein